MSEHYILAIDQGTSGTKTVIFNSQGNIAAKANVPLKSYFPQVGFVEQDPQEIYQSVLESVNACLHTFTHETSGRIEDIQACGISNQRETCLVWDREGQPLANAVVWQCKRSVEICTRLKAEGIEEELTRRTGLIVDPYFSGTKVIWLAENHPEFARALEAGEAYFGTVDTWLLYKLTQGKRYFTDHTNASRTLFFNINELQWDSYLLKQFNLEGLNLPEIKPSSYAFGESDFEGLFPAPLSISGMIGDSHAASFGEGCFTSGTAKATMGTGSSILMNTGSQRINSQTGMVSTICWSTADRVDYALEGIIVTCAATLVWLRDQLGLFAHSSETEEMALAVENTDGVAIVPAFSGIGAPHWQMDAKAAILGLTFGSTKNHIVRAALESIPFQIKDVIAAMESDSGIRLEELKADGGPTANTFVMQGLADVLDANVATIGFGEVSALGAAYMAGLECGVFQGLEQLQALSVSKNTYTPGTRQRQTAAAYAKWEQTLKQYLTSCLQNNDD